VPLGITASPDPNYLVLMVAATVCHGYARGLHHQTDENPISPTRGWICPNKIWTKLLSEVKESTCNLHIADDLLKLLQRTPGLYAHHGKAFNLNTLWNG